MGRVKLDDYVRVAERIRAFHERYPRGSIQTEMVRLEDGMVVFEARVYRGPDDPHPTTGWAYDREGRGRVNETSFIESCETSAIGRALANLGLAGGRRPSREEMEKVLRMGPREPLEGAALQPRRGRAARRRGAA
ncbi:MAG: hypothetical protein ACODAE_07150 [Gemmatimonadota bacterium]